MSRREHRAARMGQGSSDLHRTIAEAVVGTPDQNVGRPVGVVSEPNVVEIDWLRRDHSQVRDQLQPRLDDSSRFVGTWR